MLRGKRELSRVNFMTTALTGASDASSADSPWQSMSPALQLSHGDLILHAPNWLKLSCLNISLHSMDTQFKYYSPPFGLRSKFFAYSDSSGRTAFRLLTIQLKLPSPACSVGPILPLLRPPELSPCVCPVVHPLSRGCTSRLQADNLSSLCSAIQQSANRPFNVIQFERFQDYRIHAAHVRLFPMRLITGT